MQKFQHDPFATYAVIVRAAHQHLGPQAAVAYSGLLASHPNDPYIQSAYAFSQFMAVGPLSQDYFIANPSPLVRKIRLDAPKAEYYHELALKNAKNSSAIKFECALVDFYYAQSALGGSVEAKQAMAIDSLRQVAKDSPQWADAHYWLASTLDLYAAAIYSTTGPEKAQAQTMMLGQEMLAEAQNAEQIDPGYHNDCLRLYAFAYQWLQQPKQNLKYLDLYLQAVPSQRRNFEHGRQQLIKEIQQKAS